VNNHPSDDAEAEVLLGEAVLEHALKGFWERARAAGELIARLRSERAGLTDRVKLLEQEIGTLKTHIASRDQENKRLKTENAQLMNHSNGHDILTAEEKEMLKDRIKMLIAKINSHL
jgi:hypothetical protein